jgi:hydroxymethylbilane synthase
LRSFPGSLCGNAKSGWNSLYLSAQGGGVTSIRIATRKSPLALAQTQLVIAHLQARMPGTSFEPWKVVTTGDRRLEWSLEKQGGKGLFTAEIEDALRSGDATLAMHSAKDLPGETGDGDLAVAGYLPREDARDVLVLRNGVSTPAILATGSPRRRGQVAALFPDVRFVEIRGNVDTRLNKIARGEADATILAQAGLNRLGISNWPGVVFRQLTLDEMVPAVGQGAVAVQCRTGDVARFAPLLDGPTFRNVSIERAFQARLGAGCQIAFAAHLDDDGMLRLFHERCGRRVFQHDGRAPVDFAARVLMELGLV